MDLLAEANVDVHEGIAPELKEREQATHARIGQIQREIINAHSQASPDKNRISQLEDELKQIDREREQLEVEIRQKHPRYAELQYPMPLGLKPVQELLDSGTALLEYALGEDRSFLPQENVRVFLQQEAREENVKVEASLGQSRFIHFAVHGLLNETKPQFSGLVLSLPAREDSRAKTQEVSPEAPNRGKQPDVESNPKSATGNPQSATRNPQSALDAPRRVYPGGGRILH